MNKKSIYKTTSGEMLVMSYYNQLLEQWPVSYDSGRTNTRHGRTHVIACGDPLNPPLILLHGSNSNSAAWMGDVARYCQHFRVYLVDIPGEPGKSSRNRPAWRSPAFAEWLEDVLNELRLEQASIVGLSYGGWIALKYAIYQPERVNKLVLLAPSGLVPTKWSFLIKALPLSLMGKKGAEILNKLVVGEAAIGEPALEFINLIMTNFRPRLGTIDMFSDEDIKRLTMPVKLFTGAKDVINHSAKMAARLERLLPRSGITVLPDHGHVLINLTDEIIGFLLDGSGAPQASEPEPAEASV